MCTVITTEKKEVPRLGHFKITSLYLRLVILIKELFYCTVLKQPGKKLNNTLICFNLFRSLIDVQSADGIYCALMFRTEARSILVQHPLAATRGFTPIHLFTHLVQPDPRFRQRVGAAPIARLN